MDYVSALLPPAVMAVFFVGVIRVIVKTQGGANKAKEDAAVDAALARVDGARQSSATPPKAEARHDRCISRRSAPTSYDSVRPPSPAELALSSRTPFLLPFAGEAHVRHANTEISHYCSELCLAHWENSKTRS